MPTSPIAFGVYITARSSSLFSGGQDRDWKPKMERDKLNTLDMTYLLLVSEADLDFKQ